MFKNFFYHLKQRKDGPQGPTTFKESAAEAANVTTPSSDTIIWETENQFPQLQPQNGFKKGYTA